MNNLLIIFDFDFTIAKTIEHIWIRSPRGNFRYNNQIYIKVHPTELQQQGIGNDELIDHNSFIEFYSLDQEKTKIIEPIVPYIKYFSSIQDLYILTARPQSVESQIFSFLQKHNIDTEKINFIGLANSCFKQKIKWIKNQISLHQYKKLIIFEDNKKLIDYILNHKCIDIKYNLYYINNFYDKTIITYYE